MRDNVTIKQAGKHLGNNVVYSDQYDKTLLVPVERIHNRKDYNINEDALPFVGFDTWNAYEVSFLLENGFPVTAVAKVSYASSSHSIVESKSFKLYLNSLNMTKFKGTKDEALVLVANTIKEDLSEILGTEVFVHLHTEAQNAPLFDTFKYEDEVIGYDVFNELDQLVDCNMIEITDFVESPDVLVSSGSGELRVHTDLLRSNCRITNQPDWGDAYIHIKGDNVPSAESLVKYIVSFRKENHFHEEIAEMIYIRLLEKFKPEELMVTCIYTRRGGLDICPARANKQELLPQNLRDVFIHVQKDLRQ